MPKFAPKIANNRGNKNHSERMNEGRIDLLKKYIKEDPKDPFNHYGLACEYLQEAPEKALIILRGLKEDFPDYLPTYYQLAQLLVTFEEEEEALEVYKQGIAVARVQKNTKTLQELSTAYQNLQFEIE